MRDQAARMSGKGAGLTLIGYSEGLERRLPCCSLATPTSRSVFDQMTAD